MVEEANGQEGDVEWAVRRGGGTEHDPRGPGLEGKQPGLRMGCALGEEENGPAPLENRDGTGQRAGVALGLAESLARLVLAPVGRQGAQQSKDGAEDRPAELRRGGHGDQASRQDRQDEERVDEAVGMGRGDEQGASGGDVLEADHVDPMVEGADEQPREPPTEVEDNSLNACAPAGGERSICLARASGISQGCLRSERGSDLGTINE
jgi:hypothetical protein